MSTQSVIAHIRASTPKSHRNRRRNRRRTTLILAAITGGITLIAALIGR